MAIWWGVYHLFIHSTKIHIRFAKFIHIIPRDKKMLLINFSLSIKIILLPSFHSWIPGWELNFSLIW